eukprot:6068545-Prymnesium_polylepis.2
MAQVPKGCAGGCGRPRLYGASYPHATSHFPVATRQIAIAAFPPDCTPNFPGLTGTPIAGSILRREYSSTVSEGTLRTLPVERHPPSRLETHKEQQTPLHQYPPMATANIEPTHHQLAVNECWIPARRQPPFDSSVPRRPVWRT